MKPLSRLLAHILALCALAMPLAGQGLRFEIGGFGSFTRFDDALMLDDRVGGGVRLALHFNRALGLELEAANLGPGSASGSPEYLVHLGSVSLMLGGGSDRFSVYAVGGYSRFDVGSTPPYNYAENGFHGGGGFRIGLSDRLALRFDGRAIFTSDDNIAGGSAMHLVGGVGLSYFTRSSRSEGRAQPESPEAPDVRPMPEAPPIAAAPEPEEPMAEGAPPPAHAPPPVAAEPRAPAMAQRAPEAVRTAPVSARRGRAEQIELGFFGSFTRYDRSFELANQAGAGIRLGYFLSDRLSIEVEGGFQNPKQKDPGVESSTFALGSASLAFNFPAGRHSFYLLGGYTHQQWADFPPYEFSDHSVHGAVGARFFLSRRVALRLEGRAIYGWDTNSGTAPWSGQVVGSAGLSFFATPPRQRTAGGVGGRSYQWYWGGQGGALIYKTNLQPYFYDPLVGGHWMITAKRTSLYFAYEQAFFLTESRAAIFDPSAEFTGRVREVSFDNVRRILFGVLAHPAQKVIEPFGGIGFAMVQALDPTPDCTVDCETLAKAAEAFERAESASSKAFFWIMAGLQMNYSNRLNVFAHYMLTSSSRDFVLMGNTHTLQGGIRYSFGTSKEGLTDVR